MPVFQPFYEMKLKTSKLWHFEASKDIMTKFKSQPLHIIRIKHGTQAFCFINSLNRSIGPSQHKSQILFHKERPTEELYQKDFGDVTVFSLLSESRLNIILDSRERPIFRVYFWPFERRFTLCRNKLLPDDFHLLIYSLLSRNMDIPGITLSYTQ